MLDFTDIYAIFEVGHPCILKRSKNFNGKSRFTPLFWQKEIPEKNFGGKMWTGY